MLPGIQQKQRNLPKDVANVLVVYEQITVENVTHAGTINLMQIEHFFQVLFI